MIPHFIKSSEKKRIAKQLNAQFGIEKIPYLLIESGKEKIRAFSGNLSKEEIMQLTKTTLIETIGAYFINRSNELRLTIDAIHLLKDQITKNIVEINDIQINEWLKGNNIIVNNNIQTGPVILKYKDELVCYGKSDGLKILNYLPKERRVKTK